MQLPDDARLADSRLARQQHRLPFAGSRPLEPVDQQRHLVFAPDKSGEPAGAGIEAALHRPFGQHLPDPYRVGDAFEFLQAQIIEDERGPDQLSRQPADHDLVGSGERFETRREVRCFAGDGPRLAAPGGLDVADDDGAGSDPDMHVKGQFLCRRDRR